MRSRDVGDDICEQLQELVSGLGQLHRVRERPWASITFSGTRYTFRVAGIGEGDQLATVINILGNHEFELHGFFVADLLVTRSEPGRYDVEILAIADPQTDRPFRER